jgi:predicted transcriptional regulator
MCNINDYINDTALYINTMTDQKVKLTSLGDDIRRLFPLTITSEFNFYCTEIFQHKILLCFSNDKVDITPAKLSKQKELIASKIEMIPIFVFKKIVSYNLQRLVKQRINFIIPQKQMFIPDLIIALKVQKDSDVQSDFTIPPLAQCIVLYKLENSNMDNSLKIQNIAESFNVSYATAGRALRWLSANKIINGGDGKEKNYFFADSGRSLWEKVLPLLTNPIERTIHTDDTINNALLSGINALSEYTMINGDANICYAINWNILKSLDIHTDKTYGDNTIEIWRYNPKVLSKGNLVDKLSLYLSLRDSADERIQIELENMINDFQW